MTFDPAAYAAGGPKGQSEPEPEPAKPAGFDPQAYAAVGAPKEDKIAPYGLSGVVSGQKEPEDEGVVSAFAREAGNLFGLGPILGAGTDYLADRIAGGFERAAGLEQPEEQKHTF